MLGSMLSKKALNKLTQLQRTAVSLIDQNMGTDEVFKKHGILEFEKLVQFEQIKIGYKLCHSLLPTSFTALAMTIRAKAQVRAIGIILETNKYLTCLMC